ncbi:MAG: tetratricopeptide repeat protein, partial [bacterium]
MEAALGKTSIRGVVAALGLFFAVTAGFCFSGTPKLLLAVTPEPNAGPGAVDSLLDAGSYAAADSVATAHLQTVEFLSSSGDLRYARALLDLARVRVEQDRLEEADDLLLASASIAKADQEDESDLFADILMWRARIAVSLGRHAAARPLYEKSLDIKTALLGAEDPACIPSLTGLATIALIDGDFEEAETLFRRALGLAGSTANHVPAIADTAAIGAHDKVSGAPGPADGAHIQAARWIIDAVIGLATTQGYRGDYEAAEATVRPYLEAMLTAHGVENGRAVLLMLS